MRDRFADTTIGKDRTIAFRKSQQYAIANRHSDITWKKHGLNGGHAEGSVQSSGAGNVTGQNEKLTLVTRTRPRGGFTS